MDDFKHHDVNRFLENYVGLSPLTIESLVVEEDWTLVIKLHAYIEACLNFLIVRQLGRPELHEIIARLDVSDRRRGKMAFVIALDLLPSSYRSFIQKFSELRNELVHDAKNVNFNFQIYFDGLESNRRKELMKAMKGVMIEGSSEQTEENAEEVLKTPRRAIIVCVVAVMVAIYGKHLIKDYLESSFEHVPVSDLPFPKE